MKLVKLDPKHEGTCLFCGCTDLRVTFPLMIKTFWCPDCLTGWYEDTVAPMDFSSMDNFFEQAMTIKAIRRQDLAQLQEEHKRYKTALELVATQCLISFQVFESTDDTQDILDTVCDALGLDYDTEVEKAEAKGRKEREEEYEENIVPDDEVATDAHDRFKNGETDAEDPDSD